MAERVIVRQKADFEIFFEAQDPEAPDGSPFRSVASLHDLTPYGMLLASLGSCTAILLNTYAAKRGMPLKEVEVRLGYGRDFKKDCATCPEDGRYEEKIESRVILRGPLSSDDREKLLLVSGRCPIHALLEGGIRIAKSGGEEAGNGLE